MILLRVPLSLSPLLFHYVPPRFRSYSIPLVSLCFCSFSFDSFVLWILSSLSFTPSSGLWLSVRFHRSLTLCVFSVSFSWSSVDSLLHFLFRASKLFFVEILEIRYTFLRYMRYHLSLFTSNSAFVEFLTRFFEFPPLSSPSADSSISFFLFDTCFNLPPDFPRSRQFHPF